MRGISIRVEDSCFFQDIADGVVNVVVGDLALAGTEGACGLGEAVQGIVGEATTSGPQGVGDGGDVAGYDPLESQPSQQRCRSSCSQAASGSYRRGTYLINMQHERYPMDHDSH
ncbi:MAG: hypothetical protein HY694_14160 [Deltaproteobacteria bacterium]|nr:hypothetical protein [Deltaproteobacteria bacterium]